MLLKYISRFPSHYSALITKLKAWLADNLVVHDDGRVPLMDHKTHLRNGLSSTLRHYVDHTRGRLESCDDPASAFAPARQAASLDVLCARVECFFNGDIRLPCPVHIKTAETATMARDEFVEMDVLIVADASLVPGFKADVPSQSRWVSMAGCLAHQCAGFMMHNVLGAVATAVFSRWEDGAAPPENNEDMKLQMKHKAWRFKCYTSDPASRLRAVEHLHLITPLDHLWRCLQHVEEKGGVMQDMCIPMLNYFRNASKSYCRLFFKPVMDTTSMASLFGHYAPPGADGHEALLTEVRQALLQCSAHLWWRLVVPTSGYPSNCSPWSTSGGCLSSNYRPVSRFTTHDC